MISSARLVPLVIITAVFALAAPISAEVRVSVSGNEGSSNVSVHQEGSGQSTTCINGKCTTTGGDSKATVCINGDRQTSNDGNINVQSENGNAKVEVSNSTTPSNTTGEDITPDPTKAETTPTPKPTKAPEQDEIVKEVKTITDQIKEQLASLQDFFKGLFS